MNTPTKTKPTRATEMNEALKAKCDGIRKKVCSGRRRDSKLSYEIGCEVAEIKNDGATYGEHAVACVARELGYTAANIYAYAAVAERWAKNDFYAIVQQQNELCVCLTFSHFIELAKLADDTECNEMRQRALDGAWSVRELSAEIKKKRDAKPPSEKSPAELLKRMLTASNAFRNRMDVGDEVMNLLRRASNDPPTTEALKLIGANYRQIATDATRVAVELEKLAAGVDGSKGLVTMPDSDAQPSASDLYEESELIDPELREDRETAPRGNAAFGLNGGH